MPENAAPECRQREQYQIRLPGPRCCTHAREHVLQSCGFSLKFFLTLLRHCLSSLAREQQLRRFPPRGGERAKGTPLHADSQSSFVLLACGHCVWCVLREQAEISAPLRDAVSLMLMQRQPLLRFLATSPWTHGARQRHAELYHSAAHRKRRQHCRPAAAQPDVVAQGLIRRGSAQHQGHQTHKGPRGCLLQLPVQSKAAQPTGFRQPSCPAQQCS